MSKRIETFLSYVVIMLGALLASFSVVCILIPNDAIDYGTAGIAILISKLNGWICPYHNSRMSLEIIERYRRRPAEE